LDDSLGENVVTVLSKPLHFTGEFSQISFGRFSAFGLKLSLEMKATLDNFLPMSRAQKLAVRSNRRMVKSQIYTDR
jgi:hypothetical protein